LKESERRAQDSLENMHGTIGHLIDRLAMIEQDLHDPAVAPGPPPIEAADIPQPAPPPAKDHAMPATPLPVSPPLLAPESSLQFEMPAEHEMPALEPEAPLPTADTSEAPIAPPQDGAPPMATATALAVPALLPAGDPTFPLTATPRQPLDPSLPPDHPLEPGSTAGRGRSASLPASDRIAASEAALGAAKPSDTPERSTKSDFIAAARRAAQAAAADVEERGKKPRAGAAGSEQERLGARVAKRMRTLFVGAGVAAFALGALHVATKFSEDAPVETTQLSSDKDATIATATIPAAPANSIVALPPPLAEPEPQLTESTPTPTQLAKVPPAERLDILPASKPPATSNAKAASPVVRDVTGTVPLPPEPPLPAPERLQPAVPAVPAPEAVDAQLPPKLGSAHLRIAAINGEPAAAYEIAVRLAEGRRGIAPDLAEAARWFERAASHGLAPAQFRLGSLYEKGQGVRRDLDKAMKLYLAAAEHGNTKAMHNLAVLYAEGASGKPDYRVAAQWFRKGANQGLIDSQFNLGILYARGIGVPQNLAESYKWFTLAARDGDADAAKKRDDLAARLDPQSLMAARLAVQTWTPERPPAEANEVKAPAGGWDALAAPPKSSKSPSRRPRGGAGVRTPPAG
jgi:localization factor PodJL